MEWFLAVYIFINNQWVHGSEFDGWSPMAMPDKEYCEQRAEKANQLNENGFKLPNGETLRIRFECETNDEKA